WTHTVEQFLGVLTRLPRSGGQNRDIQSIIHGLLDETTRAAVRALDQLAPRRPPPGMPPYRNTEYPFFQDGGSRAPADPESFSRSDVARFRAPSARIVGGCARLISTIERAAW